MKFSPLAILTVLLATSASFAEPAPEQLPTPDADSQPAAAVEQDEGPAGDEHNTDDTEAAEAEAGSDDTTPAGVEKKTPPLTPVSEQDPFGALMRLVGSMIIVLGVIIAGAFFSRRMLDRMRVHGGRERLVNVRQVVGLGARKQVFVLDAGPHTLIIGSSGDSMRLLAKLPRYEHQSAFAADDTEQVGEATPAIDTNAWAAGDRAANVKHPSTLRDTFASVLKKLHPGGAKPGEAS